MTVQDFTFPSSDGRHQCHARLWLPEGAPRGVVQIVHGVAEHVGRYDEFAAFLTEHGFAVGGEDHLGHGETARGDSSFGWFGPKNGWTLVAEDVRALRLRLGDQFPGVPYFLFGHSMGSFLTRTYLYRWPGTVDGAILSGTGQEPAPLVIFGRILASLIAKIRGGDKVSPLVHTLSLGAYNRQFAPNRTGADWISRDEKQVDRYLADPLCQITPAVGLYRDMMGGLREIAAPRNLSRMDPDTPILFLSGDQDPVGSNGKGVRKVYEMFRRTGCREVTLKLYPGGRHEMLHEQNWQEVYEDALSWLEEHC